MKIFKINEVDNQRFYMVPKSLFENEKYKNLSLAAKLVYAILRDRISLSLKNGWYDETGEVYLNFKREHLANVIGYSKPAVIKLLQELVKFELIVDQHIGMNKANKIYVCHVELSDINAKKPETPENTRRLKKFTSGSKLSLLPEVKKVYPNYTNINDTDINKTITTQAIDVVAGSLIKKLIEFGVTKNAIPEITNAISENELPRFIDYAKEHKLGAGWLVSIARNSDKRPFLPHPSSESAKVATAKKKKYPDPNCPICKGDGYFPEILDDGSMGDMHKCKCSNMANFSA